MPPSEEIFAQQRKEMVKHQIERRGVRDTAILKAMNSVPRHAFVPQSHQSAAYDDCPLPIKHNQTISQPYIVAYMTSKLALSNFKTVLEIGTGSGYQTTILSLLCKQVFTIEYVPQLAFGAKQINDALAYSNIHYLIADGSLGWPASIQFDAILVTAGAPIAPMPLLKQLKPGGRMIIPVGERFQQMLQCWHNKDGEFVKEDFLSVIFVPLKGKRGWG
jgi:protein-L-isoaspartate(D-aspartate) O-methyltransferase